MPFVFHHASFHSYFSEPLFKTTSVVRVKKSVLRRAQLESFIDGERVIPQPLRPIEIRCSPATEKEEIDDNSFIESMLGDSQMQQFRTCRLCGEEGHFSNRCPRSKDLAAPISRPAEDNREITIRLTSLADYTTQVTLAGVLDTLGKEIADQNDLPIPRWKVSIPIDSDGNSRTIAYINIAIGLSSEKSTAFADLLVNRLDRYLLDNSVLQAEIPTHSHERRKESRYDDEMRWGDLGKGSNKQR